MMPMKYKTSGKRLALPFPLRKSYLRGYSFNPEFFQLWNWEHVIPRVPTDGAQGVPNRERREEDYTPLSPLRSPILRANTVNQLEWNGK